MSARMRLAGLLAVTGFALLGAVMWAQTPAPEAADTPRWIEQLGADEAARRETASQRLREIGEASVPELQRAARNHPDVEVRLQSKWLLDKILGESRSTAMSFVRVAAGEFVMGATAVEPGRTPDEEPHRVSITTAFMLGVHEVTQNEYRHVMQQDPSWFSSTGGGKARIGTMNTDDFPVERVSWFDAVDFCNRLSRLDGFLPYYKLTDVQRNDESIQAAHVEVLGGNGYRLPTEAEWEFACRAGTQTPFHFGSTNTGRESNVKPTIESGGYGAPSPRFVEVGRTTPVGTYPGNAWQLSDMHGNVAEWCWDRYDKDYYAASPATDPAGPEKAPHRVARGGSWMLHESRCRSATRFYLMPEERKEHVGFRVARTPRWQTAAAAPR